MEFGYLLNNRGISALFHEQGLLFIERFLLIFIFITTCNISRIKIFCARTTLWEC